MNDALSVRMLAVRVLLADPWEIVDRIWASAMAAVFAGNLENVRERIDTGLLAEIKRGRGFSGG